MLADIDIYQLLEEQVKVPLIPCMSVLGAVVVLLVFILGGQNRHLSLQNLVLLLATSCCLSLVRICPRLVAVDMQI